MMNEYQTTPRFVICIRNEGYEDDLHVKSVYPVLKDENAAKSRYLRILDETGEDYLFPASYFVAIDVPQEAEQAVLQPSSRLAPSIRSARKRPLRKPPAPVTAA